MEKKERIDARKISSSSNIYSIGAEDGIVFGSLSLSILPCITHTHEQKGEKVR